MTRRRQIGESVDNTLEASTLFLLSLFLLLLTQANDEGQIAQDVETALGTLVLGALALGVMVVVVEKVRRKRRRVLSSRSAVSSRSLAF